MQVGDRQLGETVESFLEVGIALSREPANHVRTDTAIRNCLRDLANEARELLGRVAPFHAREYGVARALQRNMKMPGKLIVTSHERDQLIGNRRRLDRAQAKACESRRRENLAHEIRERALPVRKVQAVVTEMHPGQHDLLVAGRHQLTHLAQNALRRATSRYSAGLGNDAEAARLVTAFLHLNEGTAVLHHLGNGHVHELAGLGDR